MREGTSQIGQRDRDGGEIDEQGLLTQIQVFQPCPRPAIPPAATRQVAATATNSDRRHRGRTDAPHMAPAASAKLQIRVASAHELAV
jgi:hypothetical protein